MFHYVAKGTLNEAIHFVSSNDACRKTAVACLRKPAIRGACYGKTIAVKQNRRPLQIDTTVSQPFALRMAATAVASQRSPEIVTSHELGSNLDTSPAQHAPSKEAYLWRKSQYTKTFTPRALRTRYELFYDSAEEIFDSDQAAWVEVESESSELSENPSTLETDEKSGDDSGFADLSMTRAEKGVFTIDELVQVIEQENMADICCIAVPPDREYADYLLLATGRSFKHLEGTAEFVYRYYKRKKAEWDPFVLREGRKTNWVALDFGNIVLHMMLADVREKYDIERLWALGHEYDEVSSGEPEWVKFLNQMEALPDQQPVNNAFRRKLPKHEPLSVL